MERHLSLVFTNASPGRDADFNEWYGTKHVQEVLENIPGFVSGQRYRLNPSQRSSARAGRPGEWEYLTLYELETDDVAESHAVTEDFKAAGGFTPHDGALAAGHAAWVYTVAGPRVLEEDLVPAESRSSLGGAHHLFLALTNAAPGREDDFIRWYHVHVPEVVANFPGLVTGQLFRRGDAQRIGMSPPWSHLALYDLEADDVPEYHRLDQEAAESGTLEPHAGALDLDYAVWVYSEIGPRITLN